MCVNCWARLYGVLISPPQAHNESLRRRSQDKQTANEPRFTGRARGGGDGPESKRKKVAGEANKTLAASTFYKRQG